MAAGSVDQFVNAQGIANPGLHHKTGIIDQVVGGNNIWFHHCFGKKCGHTVVVGGLAWHDQRKVSQIRERDFFLACKRRILPHKDAPRLTQRELPVIVAGSDFRLQ